MDSAGNKCFWQFQYSVYIRSRNEASNETYKKHKEVRLPGEVAYCFAYGKHKKQKSLLHKRGFFVLPLVDGGIKKSGYRKVQVWMYEMDFNYNE